MMTRTGAAILLLGVVLAGCVEKAHRLTQAEREQAAEIVMSGPPKPQHPLDIRFENKIELVGYDLGSEPLREGQPCTITWYWHVKQPLGEGWTLFTHMADADKHNRINLDAVRPSRRLYPAEQWKKGDYLKDVQEFTLPNDWNSSAASFYLGFWNGPHRLHVSYGPNDGENRALALTLPVSKGVAVKPKDAEVPRLIARRVSTPVMLDGRLDEPDWAATQSSGPFVQTMTGAPGAFAASARVLYDAKSIYIGFHVQDDFLKSTFEKHDDHLWEQDTVEVMVDPDGDGKNYFEIEVSPSKLVFDTRYDSRRLPLPFGHMDWSSQTQASVTLKGTINDDDDDDDGYTVEMAIPWNAFAAGSTPAAPPKAGETWRLNFFVLDARKSGQRAVGWSAPRVGDFHTLGRLGRVIFPQAADGTTSAAPPVPASPGAPAPVR
jgi:hypothetical protein